MGTCQLTGNISKRNSSTFQSSLIHSSKINHHSKDNLFCQICTEIYNLQEKFPMNLCINQHSACSKCVKQFAQKGIKTCPFCKMQLKPSRNRMVVDLMDHYSTADGQSIVLPMKPIVKTKVQQTLQRAMKYNYQQVIYLIYMDPKKPFERVIYIKEDKSQIPKIIDLSIFINLRKLSLKQNRLVKLHSLGILENLTHLNLGKNQIAKMQNLNQLIKLKQLHLYHNMIDKIQNINALVELQVLDLANNRIIVMENLSRLTAIRSLSLNSNKIQLIENLSQLKQLRKLWLKYNRITLIEGIFQNLKLKQVKLHGNPIDPKSNTGTTRVLKDLLQIEL